MTRIVGSDFELKDFEQLNNKIHKKAYRLEDVKDKIEKVAFDVVRFKEDDDINNLWIVQSTDDGDVIVGLYEDAKLPEKKASEHGWSAVPDNKGKEINIYYRGEPIHKVLPSNLGVPSHEVHTLSTSIKRNLQKSASYRKSLLAALPLPTQQRFVRKYPELKE